MLIHFINISLKITMEVQQGSISTNYLWNIWNQCIFKIPNTQYTIRGFSIAALRSNFFIKELNIMLDAGLSCNYSPDHIFVTHTHTDHCASLPYHIYNFNQTETKMKIYVPIEAENKTDILIKSVHTMNSNKFDRNYDIVPVKNDDTFQIKLKGKIFKIEIIKCYHAVPCVGYGFTEIKNKLKDEYIGLGGKKIVELKNQNIDIYREEYNNVFLYLGDTSSDIFLCDSIAKYKNIMIECTFILDDDEHHAETKKHMHWNQLSKYVIANPNINFILYHFSGKYKREMINEFFDKLKLNNVLICNSN